MRRSASDGFQPGLVRTVGGERVVDVAYGTHLGVQADLVSRQLQVAAAVDLLVVMQTDVDDRWRDAADGAQQ
jgi:hypothetical protein